MPKMENDFVTIDIISSTIENVMSNIESGKMLLPYIQRDFVWDTKRIYKLLDSLMRGYPMGTILIWETKRPINYREFEEDYPSINDDNGFKAADDNNTVVRQYVLDGQQRLQSLYIAAKGSYNGNILFFNLKSSFKDKTDKDGSNKGNTDKKYTFIFRPVTFNMNRNNWLNVPEFLSKSFNPDFPIIKELIEEGIISNKCSDKDRELMISNAQRLYDVFKVRHNVPIQLLTNNVSLIDIAEIFVRSNSGGVILTPEDLTMAMITGRWVASSKSFNELIDKIQKLGFDKPKEFILQACDTILTVLKLKKSKEHKQKKKADAVAISDKLREDFIKISISIISILQFISKIDAMREFTYNKHHNPIFIIIAYYYTHCMTNRNVWNDHVSNVRTFLLIFLLAKDCRRLNKELIDDLLEYIISDEGKDFSLDKIKERFEKHDKKFELNIDALLNIRMDSFIAPLVLYFIYYGQPDYKPEKMTVRDHIFPKSQLESIKTFDKKIKKEKRKYSEDEVYSILNCELLTKDLNKYSQNSKGATLPMNFFYNKKFFKNKEEADKFIKLHAIPMPKEDEDDESKNIWHINNYKDFLEERRELLKNRLINKYEAFITRDTRKDNVPDDIKNFIKSLNKREITTSLTIDDD